MARFIALIMLMSVCAGCRVPPRAGDPTLPERSVNRELLIGAKIYVHIAELGDARLPIRALDQSLATLKRHLHRPIEVVRHPPIAVDQPESDDIELAAEFPVFDGDRLITRADFSPKSSVGPPLRELRLRESKAGLLGVACLQEVSADHPGWSRLQPIVEPSAILVMAVPGNRSGSGHTGWTTSVLTDDLTSRRGLVVLRQSAIERHASLMVPAERLWTWTLTHELGHVLGIPVGNEHSCVVRGYGGIHCTRPECVMSTGVDWRTVVSGVLRGWPLDYCDSCSAEIASVYVDEPDLGGRSQPVGEGMGAR